MRQPNFSEICSPKKGPMSPPKTPLSPSSRPKLDKKTGLPIETLDPNVISSTSGYFTKKYENSISPSGSRNNSPGMSSRAMSPVLSV